MLFSKSCQSIFGHVYTSGATELYMIKAHKYMLLTEREFRILEDIGQNETNILQYTEQAQSISSLFFEKQC